MLITISGFVFILIITGTNMQVDSRTGELLITFDWSQYIEEDTGIYDPWVYDPFNAWTSQNRLLFISWMVTMYYATMAIFVYYWFKYMKWKCVNGYDRVKEPDNMLYMIELQEKKYRSEKNVFGRKNKRT